MLIAVAEALHSFTAAATIAATAVKIMLILIVVGVSCVISLF